MSWQSIPAEMRVLPQWIGVRIVWNTARGKYDKYPVDPKSGRAGSVSDPSTWGTFEQATSCGLNHIGFVLTKEDPYCIVDLDTYGNPELVKLHAEIVKEADTYTETSLSMAGSHIVLKGDLEHGLRQDDKGLEVYPHGRYILMTGWVYHDTEIRENQELLDYLASMITSTRVEKVNLTSEDSGLSDEDVYNRACQAENRDKFLALYTGQWEAYSEYQNDHSRADLGLCTFLDFYTKDVDQVIRLFKNSALYRPEKGRRNGDGSDYIVRTLTIARSRNLADLPPDVDATELQKRIDNVMQQAPAPKPWEEEAPEGVDREALRKELADAEKAEANSRGNKAFYEPHGELTLPPGIIGEIANYVYHSATRQVKEVAIMASLAMVAGIVGRQFNIPGSGLNLYLILLAPTGTGKEGAASGINNLTAKVRETVPAIDQFSGPAEFASGPGLIKALDKQPCFYSIIGEFGLRLQQMADVRANGAERTLQKALLNLYSKSGWHQTENGSAYSDREKNTSVLYAPALTIFGESTPETFFSGLNEQHVLSGLLPRFAFLEYKGERPPRNKVSAFCDPDPELVSKVADLAATSIQLQANSACQSIFIDENASALLDKFDKLADNRINGGSEVYKHLWNRAHLKALRLAGVIAVGVNWVRPVITEEIATWAIQFIYQDVTSVESRFTQEQVGEGEHRYEAEIRKAVERYLQMSPEKRMQYKVPKSIINEPVIPYAYLRRRLRQLNGFKQDRRGTSRAIQEALRDLCDGGILALVPPMRRSQQYNIQSDLYVIGESW